MSVAATIATQTLITYEHPVNEQMRLYLRLEQLFNTFHTACSNTSTTDSKAALVSLLQLINVTDRSDLKSKLVQLLTLVHSNLSQLGRSPAIDHRLLDNILGELDSHIRFYDGKKDKLGHALRQHEFLNQVRLKLTHPAGLCDVSLHTLHLWLKQPIEQRQMMLNQWHQPFRQLDKTIKLLLSLIRDSAPTENYVAQKGHYQLTQDNSLPCELVRVTVATDLAVFPEISANKHRVMIRFLAPDLATGKKPVQTTLNLPFSLACCRV